LKLDAFTVSKLPTVLGSTICLTTTPADVPQIDFRQLNIGSGKTPNDQLFLEVFSYAVFEAPQIEELERNNDKKTTHHQIRARMFK
jgi:hypothetical protein